MLCFFYLRDGHVHSFYDFYELVDFSYEKKIVFFIIKWQFVVLEPFVWLEKGILCFLNNCVQIFHLSTRRCNRWTMLHHCLQQLCRYHLYTINNNEPNTEYWGTPHVTPPIKIAHHLHLHIFLCASNMTSRRHLHAPQFHNIWVYWIIRRDKLIKRLLEMNKHANHIIIIHFINFIKLSIRLSMQVL